MFFPEIVESALQPSNWLPLDHAALLAGIVGLTAGCARKDDEDVDLDELEKRVGQLEKISPKTQEQNSELAAHYAAWAVTLYNNDEGELEDILELFAKAEEIYKTSLEQDDIHETRRQLGNVYLEWGVVHNEYGELPSAVEAYDKAIKVLKPVSDSGDGEAKYDIAGIKLNLGIAYSELGMLDEAKASLDEAFIEYRAIEKISALDTRLYMAVVSVQQGNILHEMGDKLDNIVDAYNRAMRLYVEVIEDQNQIELERDLANVLIDRSTVIYEDWANKKFESAKERMQVVDDVLLDIDRSIQLLEKQQQGGDEIIRYDLFHAVALQGRVLCDAEYFEQAKEVLDRAIEEFADLVEEEDAVMMQMAMAYATRAIVQMGLGHRDLSEQDCLKGSELINQFLQSDGGDAEVQELKQQFQAMLEALAEVEEK
ncbi:MAG: hypothetical protein FWG73_01940 [Planctomycetaceae bacterium]|nr:hypothetical protein [Planctomycetaceae bacterium]